MLRFFRKIRQKLLENGNLRKYFWYALGEILLVMIGILLALQVNNWNGQRKQSNLETELLNEIRSDLKVDSIRFSGTIEFMEEQNKNADVIRNHMENDLPYHDSLDIYFSAVSFMIGSAAETAGFESLNNAGILTVRSDSLRKDILNYYEYALFVESVTGQFDLAVFFRERIYPSYFKSFSWGSSGAKPSDYEALKKSNEFNIALDYVRNDSRYYKSQYELLLTACIDLLNKINKELSR